MPTILRVLNAPTVINSHHQSLYRNYDTLRYVRYLLENDVPQAVILKILDDLEELPPLKTEISTSQG